MDAIWRPPPSGEPAMEAGDWRSQLQGDSRQRIVNKIMDTLKRYLPFSGQEGLQELKKIAVSCEEKIYAAATSQSDYLRKIYLKMPSMESKSQNTINNSVPSNSAGNSNRPPDPGSFGMQAQASNQGQSLSLPVPANQSQARQQLLAPNIQNNIPSSGVQNPAGLSSVLPPASGLTQTPIGQSTNLQSMSGTSQNSLGNSMGQGVASNMFANSPRPMPGRQQVVPQQPASPYPVSSGNQLLQAQSPQLSQHSSPQVDQQLLVPKAGTPLQNASSPFVIPSPSTPMAPSPMPGESEKPSSLSNVGNVGHQPTAGVGAQVQSLAIGTPGISASPLLAEFSGPDGIHANALSTISGKSSVTEKPLERLIKAVKSVSAKALSTSVSDIGSVVSMIDRIAGSAPGNGSRAAVGEDLVAMTKCRLQARNFVTHDGTSNGTRKMKRYTSAMPLNVVSSGGSMNDSFKHLTGSETPDLESTAKSRIKRPKFEANHALMEEIREINRRLIDTVVDISDEDVDPNAAAAERGEGTIVKCSFEAMVLSPNLKSQYASAQMSPIQPLRLLVPKYYPNCSPILLDKIPVEVSKEYEDLSVKAKSRFSICLRTISQPMSLGEIARTWDICARAVISEHAQRSGGGSFSSKYGTWENCLNAA